MTDVRAYAIDFLSRATNGATGVSRGSAPYERVTEGRHSGGGFYSACGDLANALLFALGVRDKRFVNRAENANSYRIGWNVATLDSLAKELRNYTKRPITHADVTSLQPGDVTIVWNRPDTTDAHVAVVRRYDQGKLHTSDYGQGAPLDGKECIRVVQGTLLGNRKLQRIIPLVAATERFATAEPIPVDAYFAPEQMHRRTLRKGDKGSDVTQLQALLGHLKLDGDFGPKTETQVMGFQAAHGLVVDGVVGRLTWAALESK